MLAENMTVSTHQTFHAAPKVAVQNLKVGLSIQLFLCSMQFCVIIYYLELKSYYGVAVTTEYFSQMTRAEFTIWHSVRSPVL